MLRGLSTVLLALALTGCAAQQRLVAEQSVAIDSLEAANAALFAELAALQDSLAFYDDIDSGRYYRRLRVLGDEINALDYQVALCRDGGRTVATLLADDLFEPGTAALTNAGRAAVAALSEQLRSGFPDTQHFRVEGHADAVPLGPSLQARYPSNWELSAARAAAVVRLLMETHGWAADRFEVVGFGATRPVASNERAAGRRQNRRVRVAVLPAD